MGPSVPPGALHLILLWCYSGSCTVPDAAAPADQLRRLAKATGLSALATLAGGASRWARRADRPPDLSADLGRLLLADSLADGHPDGEREPPFWDVLLTPAHDASSSAPEPGRARAGIGAHRVVLVSRSQYLRALLSPGAFRDVSGAEVAFPEISSLGALRALRRWLYTDEGPWESVGESTDRGHVLETALEAVQVYGAMLLWVAARGAGKRPVCVRALSDAEVRAPSAPLPTQRRRRCGCLAASPGPRRSTLPSASPSSRPATLSACS